MVKVLAETEHLSTAAQHSSVNCCISVLRQLPDLMTVNGTREQPQFITCRQPVNQLILDTQQSYHYLFLRQKSSAVLLIITLLFLF